MQKFRSWIRKHKKQIVAVDVSMILALAVLAFAVAEPAQARNLKVDRSDYSSAVISWDEADNAQGYKIYRSQDDREYEYIGTVTSTTYTDKNLRTGKTYYYKVASRNGLKTSDIDKGEKTTVTPSLEKPELTVDTSEGEIKLSISEVEGAIGYEIIRNGKVVANSKETTYIDKEANNDEAYNYKVKAYRYNKEPVYSKASETHEASLHAVPNFTMSVLDDDLMIEWGKSDYYSNYKLFNGDELLAETGGDSVMIENIELNKTYDLKFVGYSSDGENQSPEIEKNIQVVEEPMTNEDAINAACDWGVAIAADDSFTYGDGKRAHRYGCYFCGTNTGPNKNLKGKSLVKGHSYEKTYCCNPFVHACYAHGAGDPNMLKACQKGKGIAMTEKSYTRYGNWKNVGKVSKGNLKRGDVLVRSNHVMLYIGDGKIVHASGGGWDAGSIEVTTPKRYSFVMRYTGTGRGTKRVIKEVEKEEVPEENADANAKTDAKAEAKNDANAKTDADANKKKETESEQGAA